MDLQKVRPKVIISAEKVVIEVGAYDELSSKVVKVPGESKYWSCLADVVPQGELENRGECDKGVNILDMEGGGLAEDVQNRETNREETTEHKHNAKEEQLTGQSQRLHIVGWNWRKIPTQRRGGTSKRPVHSSTGRQQRFSGKSIHDSTGV